MVSKQSPERHRFCLPPGTVVKGWRLLGCQGHGAHGVVYRALRVGQEAAGFVALKMALFPWDPRFMREVGLLSLVHHPSIPNQWGLGFWKHPAGSFHPFLVMDWIDGTPLYEWARQQRPSSERVLQVLAQLARALQAAHEVTAVHRDVKGDNVLVRHSDGRAMLTDFGTGNYRAAARVTWQPLPPGTPAYQSPEAGLFQIRSVGTPDARYLAGPADDVYALGVTAYRLVTGEYPPSPEPELAADGTWHMKEVEPPEPQKRNSQVDARLSALIVRMLSLSPEARGTAGALADELEAAVANTVQGRGEASPTRLVHAAQQASRVADDAPSGAEVSTEVSALTERAWLRAQTWGGSPWLVLALAGVFLASWLVMAMHVWLEGTSSVVSVSARADGAEERLVDLGELAPAVPLTPEQEPSKSQAISQGQLPKPRPGQLSPDAKGRCPGRKQVPLNGGCWVELSASDSEECEPYGFVLFKGRCYAPVMGSPGKPPPTSAPPQ